MQLTSGPVAWATAAVAALLSCGGSERQPTSPSAGPAGPWHLVWSDEFSSSDGSGPDGSKWVFDSGGGGWGNNELQSYTDRRENSVIRNGVLAIRALKEPFTGADGVRRDFTSARLKTLGRFSQRYGRFEARLRIPRGQGIWPAFWMLGDDIERVGWPACGEIDVMESIGREPMVVHGTLHGPGYSGSRGIGASFKGSHPFAEDFHVFAVEWEPEAIRWAVDGVQYQSKTPADLPGGARWVFDRPFFLLLNVAVGGNWPGSPDDTTVVPQEMLVDWVRVHSRSTTNAPASSRSPR
jgi:beta-glucanase (GH16 family)